MKQLNDAIQEAIILGHFKLFCEKYASADAQRRARTIYSRTDNSAETTKNIFENEFGVVLSETDADRLFTLITSFLKKSAYRKPIGNTIRKSLLKNQFHHCAICGRDIDIHAHADHIIPFKFVGDELEDNLQMLCGGCNLKKNESLDYQVRFLLKMV